MNSLSGIINWEFMNEPLYRWALFAIAWALILFGWSYVLGAFAALLRG